MRRLGLALAVALAALAAVPACKRGAAGAPLRLGYFPNVTHAQALVGVDDGTYARALGGKLVTRVFNAGPAAMEALVAGDLDAPTSGPGPAAIAYLRTHGEAIRVIAGAASGGAVARRAGRAGPADLAGKRVALARSSGTPRTWRSAPGSARAASRWERPGPVNVTPLSNPDILSLFARGALAGAWVPEPWGARLVAEAGGRILVDERTLWPGGRFPTTVLAVSQRALAERRPEIDALLRAHAELTRRFETGPRGVPRRGERRVREARREAAPAAGPRATPSRGSSSCRTRSHRSSPSWRATRRRSDSPLLATFPAIVDGRPLQELARR